MKFFCLFIICLLFSCKEDKAVSASAQYAPKSNEETEIGAVAGKDSLSPIITQLKGNPYFSPDATFSITDTIQSGNRSILKIDANEPNCHMVLLGICDTNGSLSHLFQVVRECDTDLSAPVFERFYGYSLDNKSLQIFKVTETVKDKKLITPQGTLKNGLTRDKTTVVADSAVTVINMDKLENYTRYPEVYPR